MCVTAGETPALQSPHSRNAKVYCEVDRTAQVLTQRNSECCYV